MIFCWYVFMYVEIMLFLPCFDKYIVCYSLRKTIFLVITMLVIVKILAFLLGVVFTKESFFYIAVYKYFYRYVAVVVSGYLCAKYGVLEKIEKRLRHLTLTKKVLLIVTCLLFYNFVDLIAMISTGFFLCPVFIAVLLSLDINYTASINKLVLILGKYSMNTWFFHCLFFAEATRHVFQQYGFWLGDPILSFLWILIVSTILSIFITKLQQIMNRKVNDAFKVLI